MYWKWSVVKSLLLSSKVPANPRLHQCSQCNYLPSSVEKLFVQYTDKQQEDLGFYLTIIVSSYSATTCPHLSRNGSPRTLSRRLMLQKGDHHTITHDYHPILLYLTGNRSPGTLSGRLMPSLQTAFLLLGSKASEIQILLVYVRKSYFASLVYFIIR